MYKPSKRDKHGMNYGFRFHQLKEEVAKKLADDLKKYNPTVRKMLRRPGYGLSLRLNKSVKAKFLAETMQKHKIRPNETDIFASLLTVKDTGIIGVPEYVNEVLYATHSNLTFSFTYVDVG